jgi:hypothetical protein
MDYTGNDQRRVLQIWENYITELYDRANRPEQLEVETEDEVDEDEKGPYILQSEVEKAIKEMRDKKATGDDDVPGDVLKVLGEDGLKLMTQLINCVYVTGQWPRDFIEVTMIALKKKPKAKVAVCRRFCSTYTVNTLPRKLLKGLETSK